MKLSDAIIAGIARVERQHVRGYFDPKLMAGDTLFSAYMGLPRASTQPVLRAYGLHGTDPARACRLVQDALLKAWPALLARAPEAVYQAARACSVREPRTWLSIDARGTVRMAETLMGYIARLNDQPLPRERIAEVLSRADL